jgi:hypothetical protein
MHGPLQIEAFYDSATFTYSWPSASVGIWKRMFMPTTCPVRFI